METAIFKHLFENYIPQSVGGLFMVGLVVVYYFNKKVNGHSKRITTQESINHTQEISIAVMGKDIKTIKDNQEQQMKMLNNINNHLMK